MGGSRRSSKLIKSKKSFTNSGTTNKVQQLVMKYENNSKEKTQEQSNNNMLRLNSKSIKSKSRNFLPSKSNKLKGAKSMIGFSRSKVPIDPNNDEQTQRGDNSCQTANCDGGGGGGEGAGQIVKNSVSQNSLAESSKRSSPSSAVTNRSVIERGDSPHQPITVPGQVQVPNCSVSKNMTNEPADVKLKPNVMGNLNIEDKANYNHSDNDDNVSHNDIQEKKKKTVEVVDTLQVKPVKDIIQNIYQHFYNNNNSESFKQKEKIKTDLIISDLVKLYSNSVSQPTTTTTAIPSPNNNNTSAESNQNIHHNKSSDQQDQPDCDSDTDIDFPMDQTPPKPKKCSEQVTQNNVPSAPTDTNNNDHKIADESQTGGRGDDLTDDLDEHTDTDTDHDQGSGDLASSSSGGGGSELQDSSDLDEYKEYETFYQRLQSIIQSKTGILVQDLNISFDCYRNIASKCSHDDRWLENIQFQYQPKVVVIKNFTSIDSGGDESCASQARAANRDEQRTGPVRTGQPPPPPPSTNESTTTSSYCNQNNDYHHHHPDNLRCFNEKVQKVRIQNEEVFIYTNGVTVDYNYK